MKAEYNFSNGTRGKYAKRYTKDSNVIVLAPDVVRFFKDSASVNRALRSLIKVAEANVSIRTQRNRKKA